MRIAIGLNTEGSLASTIERAKELRNLGFESLWASQIFGPDTLTVFAVVGREVPDVDLGTAVVPIQPRHPSMLAAQARTVQESIGGHLTLGIGLSHQIVVESLWGLPFDRPATYMHEYLDALMPMLRGETVMAQGERIKVISMDSVGPKETRVPSVIVAALGPRMLELAGTYTDGTALWMTGPKTVASHIKPLIDEAAAKAGRPRPRIVCGLPISVTSDIAGASAKMNKELEVYPTLPSYAAMMKREGAEQPSDLALMGSKQQVLEQLNELGASGVTEFNAQVTGTKDEIEATYAVLLEFSSK
jgi:F420-dependent oxidoreductase-like protein